MNESKNIKFARSVDSKGCYNCFHRKVCLFPTHNLRNEKHFNKFLSLFRSEMHIKMGAKTKDEEFKGAVQGVLMQVAAALCPHYEKG